MYIQLIPGPQMSIIPYCSKAKLTYTTIARGPALANAERALQGPLQVENNNVMRPPYISTT